MVYQPRESYDPTAAFYWLTHSPPRKETVFTRTLPSHSQSVPYTYLNLIFHCSPVRWVLIPLVRWRKQGSKRRSNFLTQASMRSWAQMWLKSRVFHAAQLPAVFHSWALSPLHKASICSDLLPAFPLEWQLPAQSCLLSTHCPWLMPPSVCLEDGELGTTL